MLKAGPVVALELSADTQAALLGYCLIELNNLSQLQLAVGDANVMRLQQAILTELSQRFPSFSIRLRTGGTGYYLYFMRDQTNEQVLAKVSDALHAIAQCRIDLPNGSSCSTTAHAGLVWCSGGGEYNPYLYSNGCRPAQPLDMLPSAEREEMTRRVIAACACARHRQREFCVYGECCQTVEASARLVFDLPGAMAENRLVLMAQEIVNLVPEAGETRRLYEILLQLRDRDGSVYSPSSFIPWAESSSLIERIDRWVVETSLLKHKDALLAAPDVMVSLNLSGRSLGDETLWGFLHDVITRAEIAFSRVQLEVTETAEIRDLKCAAATISKAREAGCIVALDDFGAGLSGYSYLKNLAVDAIKIDGGLIPNVIDPESIETEIVRSLVALASRLGLEVVAEHVSSPEILQALRDLGIAKMQGYAVAMPKPFAEILASHASQ